MAKLTAQQEAYCKARVYDGLTQRQAMLKAYPKRETWSGKSVDEVASRLEKNIKIKSRMDFLASKIEKETRKLALWSREDSIEQLKNIVDINRQEIDRLKQVYEDEEKRMIQLKADDPGNAKALNRQIFDVKKKNRISQPSVKAVQEAVAEMNRMHGYNESNINMNTNVVFTGEEEMLE